MALLQMLSLNKQASTYQPKPRVWSYAGAVGGQCVVYAGFTEDFAKSKEELSSTVEIFDHYLEQWRVLKTTGSPPKGLYRGGYCFTQNGNLYLYGGRDGSHCRSDGLYKLPVNSEQLEWSQLSVASANGPMQKVGCGMVCFGKDKLAIIGGCGIPHGSPQPGSKFIENLEYTDGRGYTNEIHFFDIENCKEALAI